MEAKHLLKRIMVYLVGLLILAFGVAVSVNSGLGVSPVNSLPYVISQITQLGLGTCVTFVFIFYILLQLLLLPQNFRLIDLTQILYSTLFGYFVDFAKLVLGDFSLPTYIGRLIMLAVSMFLIAVGVSLYVGAGLVNMPMEGLTGTIVALKPGRSFHSVKMAVDTVIVVSAALLSITVFGSLRGVREGTILSALFVGPIMKPIQKLLNPTLQRIFNK